MTDKMREEFEEKFPNNAGFIFDGDTYVLPSGPTDSSLAIYCLEYRSAWRAWQAAKSVPDAELERLRNRVASAERDLAVAVAEGDRIMCEWQEQIRKTCAALKQRNDAEQACDALRKDAERYRWIRSSSVGPDTVWHVCMEHLEGGLSTLKSDSLLDESIDAAIAAEGEKE